MADEVIKNCAVTIRQTQIVAKETAVHRIVKQTPTPPRVISACKQGPPGPPGETPPAGSFEWNSTNW